MLSAFGERKGERGILILAQIGGQLQCAAASMITTAAPPPQCHEAEVSVVRRCLGRSNLIRHGDGALHRPMEGGWKILPINEVSVVVCNGNDKDQQLLMNRKRKNEFQIDSDTCSDSTFNSRSP